MSRSSRACSSNGRALALQARGRWFDSSLAHLYVAVAQRVERPSETRGAAGSIPAGHTVVVARRRSRTGRDGKGGRALPLPPVRLRSLDGRAPGSYPGRCRFDACRGHSLAPTWKDCHRRGIPSRKRVGLRALGVRLPLLPPRSGVVERVTRRATVNRERQVRALPPEPLFARAVETKPRGGVISKRVPCPRGRTAMTPGPQPGGAGSTPAGGSSFTTGRGGDGTPPASGAGDRRFDSCRPDSGSSRRRRSRTGRDMEEGGGFAGASRSRCAVEEWLSSRAS